MYEIETLSGSLYTIHNGRLTRKGDEIRTDPGIRMVNLPFTTREAPTVDRQWHFTVVIGGERKYFSTSLVTAVYRYQRTPVESPSMMDSYIDAALAAEAKFFADLDAL